MFKKWQIITIFTLLVLLPFLYVIMFKKIVTYVIYATRPLWDYELHEELSRWKTVPNLGVFDDDNEIVCAAHNFSVRKNLHRRSGILLFDVFLFNSEWDILEIRLHELSKVVDRFVILEAECTFSGGWKPLTFQKILSGNHSLYSRYYVGRLQNICYILIHSLLIKCYHNSLLLH